MRVYEAIAPQGFDGPTDLPKTAEEARQWQEANRSWWERYPMRYDQHSAVGYEEFTREFYEEIDHRFFSNVQEYMPWKQIPFDPLVDFLSLRDKDVLEIGVGNGSHAQLFARHARSFTGIDITDYAVRSTTSRMRCFELDATILRMDAEEMQFDDDTFDLVWTWGVIHHSANTRRVLEEIRRVLRPGGTAIAMVYHRSAWNYWVLGGLCWLTQGGPRAQTSWHRAVQCMTDGAIARYYSVSDWQRLLGDLFTVEKVAIFGSKSEVVPLPGGRLKRTLLHLLPDALGRLLMNRLRMGSFLVSTLRKTR